MSNQLYDVGGVMLPRPFRIRRLGHFGLYVDDAAATKQFYCDVLGFRISDPMDLAEHSPRREDMKKAGDTNLYFTRHGTDHHSFVFFDRNVFKATGRSAELPDDVTVHQLTWQVGSLAEVSNAIDYFGVQNVRISRVGRDMPGSNWHVYPFDPESHRNELYYGIEQIGWLGMAKPKPAHDRKFLERPTLPQVPEYAEVNEMREQGIDLASGFRHPEAEAATYDVEGILLPRPFKVVRIGPVGLFCKSVDVMERFYTDKLGFELTEEVTWKGHRCVFLSTNTEHHSLALYPIALRETLGFTASTTLMRFGMQVGSYRQLRNALHYLQERGCRFIDVPRELSPGIDYSAYVLDPSGHAIQLYFAMEQVNKGPAKHTGRPIPQAWNDWPETVPAGAGSFLGETYLGPWG